MYMQRHSSQGPASFSHIGPRALELVRLQQSIPSFGDRKFSSATAADPQWRLNLKDHMDRVAAMSTLIAVTLGVGRREAALIGEAGRVHDLGKVFVNPLVLEKPGPLSDAEMRTVQMHTVWGDALLRKNDDPCLALAAKVALQHHENWDGSGYPYGLSGQQIGFAARIVSICDVYDSLREARPYKLALTHYRAMAIITKGDERTRPGMFDPSILAAFVRNQELCCAIFDGFVVGGRHSAR